MCPAGGGTLHRVRLILVFGAGAYLALAALGHARERTGSVSCECRADCWCKRPGLNVFRWVFPLGHSFGG
jgi:hypothetical protein